MTKPTKGTGSPDEARCRWCGRGFPPSAGPGRPRQYCRRSCRQRDYEARHRAGELGLSEGELVVTKAELDDMTDRLYVLQCAIEDVERDLPNAGNDPQELREALEWLLDAARQATGA